MSVVKACGLSVCPLCRYRTLKTAVVALTTVWLVSFGLMFPVLLYVDHVPQSFPGGLGHSCVVRWPSSHGLLAARAYLTHHEVGVAFWPPRRALANALSLLTEPCSCWPAPAHVVGGR